jgi:hypothetical protein
MKVSWNASDSPFAVDFVVQFKLRTESDFTTYTITDDTEVFIPNVVSNQKYDIRVCARNNLGMRSDFVRAEHTVQGFFPIFPRTKSHDQDMSS